MVNQSAAFRKSFGNNLKGIRLSHNLSQEALAHKSGLHRTYISSVERGERNISLNNIGVLARTLEVEVAAFFID